MNQNSSKIIASSKVNYWTGNEGKLFEAEFSKWVGVDMQLQFLMDRLL